MTFTLPACLPAFSEQTPLSNYKRFPNCYAKLRLHSLTICYFEVLPEYFTQFCVKK